jgi:tRNA/rRNA methyltransferase/tRNA (cytidine32/uridine32-2'-O)-methyltransferase
MMNMGLSRLRIVPESPEGGNWDEAQIRARAVHAAEIWERAESFPSLAEAAAGFPLVIGTTRRMGSRRKAHSMTPEETAAYLAEHPGPAALVFGNERTGLQDDELDLCNLAAHIPAAEAFPSLNLSHAVQIFCYELYRALKDGGGRTGRRWVPLDQDGLNGLTRSITNSLQNLGFYKQPGREEQERFFRDIFARAALTQREAEYVERIIAKASRLSQARY